MDEIVLGFILCMVLLVGCIFGIVQLSEVIAERRSICEAKGGEYTLIGEDYVCLKPGAVIK